ncbi:unnamed protein product [Brachionus calyciflorus]|uniref:HSF-type DNA-binding domain-containing protein n=1 Tax=Brachionus calyciflorus TaxID=104777 RepID=A0A813TVE0_9BILA|nr:unnamed protein product [Brachionus calyciflorus]
MPLSSPNFEYTTTNIPAFLSKLWTLVEDPKYDELIAWDQTGFSFHVYDQTRFAREILPRFFKHNNMASFIRQLNMYGFRKVNSIDHGSLKNEKEDMEFHHPYFIRGKEQFLEFIKRKVPDLKVNGNQSVNANSNANSNQQALTIQYPQIKHDELNKVLDDVNSIKSKQKMVDDSLFNVKKENEALWKEIAALRQKHHHQQQIVNKLIHFLVHLVNPSSISSIKRTRPLMIDNHITNLSNEDKSLYQNLSKDIENNIIDNDEDDDEELYSIDNLRNGTNGFNIGHSQHIVELNDDDDDENSNDESTKSRKRSISRNNLDYINDAEIETINTSKNTSLNGKHSNINNTQPSVKKLKTTPDQHSSSEITTINLYQPNTNLLDLKNQLVKKVSSKDQGFLDTNLFLNTSNNSNTTTSSIQKVNNNDSLVVNTSPILTSQNTLIENLNSPNKIYITETHNNNNNSNIHNNDVNETSSSSTSNDQNTINAFKRPISSLKNPYSSSQMNEHVESLQLDLNSIKDFLSQNSFNQVDPYTVNNLFSPILLDHIDNDQYLETPLPVELNIDSSIQVDSNTINTSNSTNIVNTSHSVTTSSDSNQNRNGKIIGTELIQYEPFNISDMFQFDDIFSNDLKTTFENSTTEGNEINNVRQEIFNEEKTISAQSVNDLTPSENKKFAFKTEFLNENQEPITTKCRPLPYNLKDKSNTRCRSMNCRKRNGAVNERKVLLTWNDSAQTNFEKLKQTLCFYQPTQASLAMVLYCSSNKMMVISDRSHIFQEIIAKPFFIKTDPLPLTWTQTKKNSHARLERWLLRLSVYDFEILHVPGKENIVADNFSRLSDEKELNTEPNADYFDTIVPEFCEEKSDVNETQTDENLIEINEITNSNETI